MGLERFTIALDNANAVYFPGQVVSGIVHVWNDKSREIKGIYAKCQGQSKVHFSKQEREYRTVYRNGRHERELTTVTRHYTSNEDYFYHKIPVFEQGGQFFQLSAGRHELPFSFVLPPLIPSSFEGKHGHVRYTIRAVLKRSLRFDKETKIAFTVNTLVNLNNMEEATMPVSKEDSTTLGFFCCESGPITARFWLDRVGYAPGEKILVNAEVENLSRKRMIGTKVRIVQVTDFVTPQKTERDERIISETERGPFNEEELYENHPMILPPVPPSGLPHCNIIHISYVIRFILNPATLSFNLVLPLTLLIGSVPLRSYFSAFENYRKDRKEGESGPSVLPSAPSLSDEAKGSFGTAGPSAPPPDGHFASLDQQYPDLPPPTYEECMFGADIREADDSEHVNYGAGSFYNPRYLTYR